MTWSEHERSPIDRAEDSGAAADNGLLGVIARLPGTALGILRNRIELFAVELAEQRTRQVRAITNGVFASLLCATAVILLTATVIFLLSPGYRIWAAMGFGVLYLGIGIALLIGVRRDLDSPPFPETIKQLKRDEESFRSSVHEN